VELCPVGAKRVRDDLGRARQLFRLRERVVVSLAPSWVAEFPGLPAGAMIAALKRLGFHAVSETALGAQEVSSHIARLIEAGPDCLRISTACPTVVSYIRKYHPEVVDYLTPVLSPVLAHCRLLRAQYGPELGIVFISPCIAKKEEADRHPELLELALSFADLRRWFEEEGVDPAHAHTAPDDVFVPHLAEEGGLYPVDGGMIAGIDPQGLL
jgi:iron only hydrogenase large subunit-like protein